MLIDLSHEFADGMPGFSLPAPDGGRTRFSAQVRTFLSREQSARLYEGRSAFEIAQVSFQSSVGTYLDSPYVRYGQGRDIGALALEEVVLPGVCVDARGLSPGQGLPPARLPPAEALRGRAVLFHFGWDCHWGTSQYERYPFIGRPVIDALLAAGARLVGVDTLNIDEAADLDRPAHSLLLAAEVLIVENLAGLEALHGRPFRFFAVPLKARGLPSWPVRAFAEVP